MTRSQTLRRIGNDAGYGRLCPRSDVPDEIVDILRPHLAKAIATGVSTILSPLPYWIQARRAPDELQVAIGHKDDLTMILVTMTVRQSIRKKPPVLQAEMRPNMRQAMMNSLSSRDDYALLGLMLELEDLELSLAWTWLDSSAGG